MKKTLNHKLLGGNVVEKVPQRKPNKTMSGTEMLNKAIYGKHTPKPDDKGWGGVGY